MRIILPGTSSQPPRPNLPILRHLTYDEVHATQLGLVGLPIGAAMVHEETELAIWFTVALMGIVFGVSKLNNYDSNAAVGVISQEPWYFTTSYFFFVGAGAISAQTFVPPPTLPDPGAIAAGSLATSLLLLGYVAYSDE